MEQDGEDLPPKNGESNGPSEIPSRGFTKLDSGIVDSTIWEKPHDAFRVWIALLAKCDAYGIVRAAVPPMARLCFVTIERFEEIIKDFAAPDIHSRTKTEEGRRIRIVDGGWVIVNYLQNRELTQRKIGSHAERQARYREKLAKRDSMVSRTPDGNEVSDSDLPTTVTSDAVASPVTRGRGRGRGRGRRDTEEIPEEKENRSLVGAKAPPDTSLVVFCFRTDGKVPSWNLTQNQIDAWVSLYPHLDVLSACRKAYAWIEANPERRKTARGMPSFLVRWLNRETNTRTSPRTAGRNGQAVQPPTAPYSPADDFDELDIPL